MVGTLFKVVGSVWKNFLGGGGGGGGCIRHCFGWVRFIGRIFWKISCVKISWVGGGEWG